METFKNISGIEDDLVCRIYMLVTYRSLIPAPDLPEPVCLLHYFLPPASLIALSIRSIAISICDFGIARFSLTKP